MKQLKTILSQCGYVGFADFYSDAIRQRSIGDFDHLTGRQSYRAIVLDRFICPLELIRRNRLQTFLMESTAT